MTLFPTPALPGSGYEGLFSAFRVEKHPDLHALLYPRRVDWSSLRAGWPPVRQQTNLTQASGEEYVMAARAGDVDEEQCRKKT